MFSLQENNNVQSETTWVGVRSEIRPPNRLATPSYPQPGSALEPRFDSPVPVRIKARMYSSSDSEIVDTS